jgi:hypothetical protein
MPRPSRRTLLLGTVAVAAALVITGLLAGVRVQVPDPKTVDYWAVCLFGGVVGLGEILSRYRDAPRRVIASAPALFYVLINAGAAALALYLIRVFGWDFGMGTTDGAKLRWIQVLVSGLGAMALFRSSLFTVRIGGEDVGVGPSSFLQVILMATDREVDRERATARAQQVAQIMEGLSFQKISTALPTLCLALMQNLPEEDQQALGRQVAELQTAPFDDRIKTLTLGLKLMNVVGDGVLRGAVLALGAQIRTLHSIHPVLPPAPLRVGDTRQVVLRGLDDLGGPIPVTGAAWTSGSPAVATVDASGVVTGVAAGRATHQVVAEGKTAAVNVDVQ